jgi:hypothetical protein
MPEITVPMNAVCRSVDTKAPLTHLEAFLSWLRLATYMAVTSVAIVTSFHLKSKPTTLELRLALPFGIIFWLLSLACLLAGLANYIWTVVRYSRRTALVQSGWKTELVSSQFIHRLWTHLPIIPYFMPTLSRSSPLLQSPLLWHVLYSSRPTQTQETHEASQYLS